jgi:hypothetical protein
MSLIHPTLPLILGLLCGDQPSHPEQRPQQKPTLPVSSRAAPGSDATPAVASPKPGPDTTRFYLGLREFHPLLLLVPPASATALCLSSADFERRLEGPLSGVRYTVSIRLSRSGLQPAKVFASVLLRKAGARRPTFLLSDPPSVAEGETLLGSTTFDVTDSFPGTLKTATFEAPSHDAASQDVLILRLQQRVVGATEEAACIAPDPFGSVYLDAPKTQTTYNADDEANRVYVLSGILTTRAGRPVANRSLMFFPVSASGTSLTVSGPPNQFGVLRRQNPTITTDSRGRFNMRVAARFFQQSADPSVGRLQVVDGSRVVSGAIPVKIADPDVSQVNLGKIWVVLK